MGESSRILVSGSGVSLKLNGYVHNRGFRRGEKGKEGGEGGGGGGWVIPMDAVSIFI